MIVATGATGQLGRQIVHALANLVPPDTIVATCRDPSKAGDLGVHVRIADFANPASLKRGSATLRPCSAQS